MAERIKILFTIPNFITAGSGTEMFNIIERLDKNIFEPWIAVMQAGGVLYDQIISKGYPILVTPFMVEDGKSAIGKLAKARKLGKSLRSHKFKLWQSFNWSSDFTEVIVARNAGAKYLFVKKNMNWNRRAWKIKSLLSRAIIVRNKTMLDALYAAAVYRKKVYYVPGGVDTTRFKKTDDNVIRKEFNIPANAILVCCIAQLVRVKDQLTLINAVADIQNVYVILAGAIRDAEYADECRHLVEQLNLKNRIIIPGSVQDVNGLLNASDMFVLPTSKLSGHEEGCPVAVLEAMGAGTPVIASDVAGSRDLIIHEQTGLLFEPGNVTALTACINRYITEKDFAQQMASAAIASITKYYTLDIEADAFAKVYKTIAS
jgi:glycosyltransferase involved in cell wall biosynthesis